MHAGTTLSDPVMLDLARYEREQDEAGAREQLIEARIPALADHLLDCHHLDVMDLIDRDDRLRGEWSASEALLCRYEARGALAGLPGQRRTVDVVADMRGTLRDAAERLARDRAAKELDRNDMTCCELERWATRSNGA